MTMVLMTTLLHYMYLMNTLESSANSDNNWYVCYLNTNQIDRKAVNDIKSNNFELDSIALNHQIYSYTPHYIGSTQ